MLVPLFIHFIFVYSFIFSLFFNHKIICKLSVYVPLSWYHGTIQELIHLYLLGNIPLSHKARGCLKAVVFKLCVG